MKIYTGSGDRGKTSLFSGERVSKAEIQVEAYGDVDELNSVIGIISAILSQNFPALEEQLKTIQRDLFTIGAVLATSPESRNFDQLNVIRSDNIVFLESSIDAMNDQLPPLQHFILPGGHIASAWAHLARTVCRRAERHIILFSEHSGEGPFGEHIFQIIAYMNRLSDYFFMLARYINFLHQINDVLWKK
ncbi:MAG: cob(I)yrinic acid a,c-diamide adenosyltransferase [Candidatus Zhuqueibacterota bacterium]